VQVLLRRVGGGGRRCGTAPLDEALVGLVKERRVEANRRGIDASFVARLA